jgi:hypothetical protein
MDIDIEKIMRPDEILQIGADDMTKSQIQGLVSWGLRMFGMGQHTVASIEDIKYEGRLVILDDGSRWEVDSVDVGTSELWSHLDKVVVIDDEMYKLDEGDMVRVSRE